MSNSISQNNHKCIRDISFFVDFPKKIDSLEVLPDISFVIFGVAHGTTPNLEWKGNSRSRSNIIPEPKPTITEARKVQVFFGPRHWMEVTEQFHVSVALPLVHNGSQGYSELGREEKNAIPDT